jgi:hypothetical protein
MVVERLQFSGTMFSNESSKSERERKRELLCPLNFPYKENGSIFIIL